MPLPQIEGDPGRNPCPGCTFLTSYKLNSEEHPQLHQDTPSQGYGVPGSYVSYLYLSNESFRRTPTGSQDEGDPYSHPGLMKIDTFGEVGELPMKLLPQLSAQTPLKHPENKLSKKVGGWGWRRQLNVLVENLSSVPSTHRVAVTPDPGI